MIPLCVAAAGLLLVLLAYGLACADRLTTGQGVAWALIGALLCAGGLLLRIGFGGAGSAAGSWALGFAVLLLLCAGVAQACAISRLEERAKRLAQEVALLRCGCEAERARRPAPPEAGE